MGDKVAKAKVISGLKVLQEHMENITEIYKGILNASHSGEKPFVVLGRNLRRYEVT